MLICCSLLVALSLAETLTTPLASISKLLQLGMPRGWGNSFQIKLAKVYYELQYRAHLEIL